MKGGASILAGSLVLFHAQAAWAGQSEPAAAPAAAEAGAPEGIEDIVVTARRTNETAQKVPLAISVVTGEAMKEANVSEFRDFARLTPSFQALVGAGDATAVILTIRGVSAQDRLLTTDSPIGIYVDGVNYARTSNLETAFLDADRVEVLKGPQGTLFGKNNTGGAVSVTTRQPKLGEFGGYVIGTVGNYDTYEALGVLNLPLVKDKLGIRVMGSHRERGGFGKDFFGRELNTKNQDAFRVNGLFESGSVRWAVSGDYTKTTGSGAIARLTFLNPLPSTLAGTPATAPIYIAVAIQAGLLNPALLANRTANAAAINAAAALARPLLVAEMNAPFYDTPTNIARNILGRTYGVSSNFSVDLLDNLQFRSISAARWAKVRSPNEFDGSHYALVDSTNFQNGVRNLSQEIQFVSSGNSWFDWIVGAYVNEETGFEGTISNSLATVNPTTNPNVTGADVKNGSWAVFGQTNIKLTDTVRATLGLRWTEELRQIRARNFIGPAATCNIPVAVRIGGQCLAQFKNIYSDASYLASIDWQATEATMLYARTARGFKGGGQNLRGTAGSVESFTPFKPETVTDYEVGVKTDLFDRRVRFNAAVYYADYKDIQRTALIPTAAGNLASVISNAAKARIQGAEGDLTVRPMTGLTFRLSGAIVDAKYKKYVDGSGDRSGEDFQFPKYSWAASVDYKVPMSFGTAGASLNYSWNSRVNLAPTAKYLGTVVQPGYGLLGGRLSATIDAIDADIAVYGKNLTNKKYFINGVAADSSFGFNAAFVGEPRQFGLTLTKRFGGE
ncbi:TonB-dependent receptor [Rhizorhabdus dicambivorans]|uniref:TonB-dependent receptor n=1 Tax=Rhizorhabdus dicambivorans TaxID=1850238 RepID=A0A2A4FXC5_9SPHN|nr:TonB-dependent receptor [Rhizorhabdus dicambivorans]ATE65983.1 TonB-dependent receptor [Rhizorhabdus dicambivorans]PCE43099.1 TonB-dependent receptor [Rhizorhabdus dicambivorans]